MNYRKLGSAGLKLSALSIGSWVTFGGQVGEDIAEKCLAKAAEAGVIFIDTAEVYANGNAETVIGNVIKKMKWRREDLVISSKVFWGGEGLNDVGLSRKHVYEACRNSLHRLQLDYLDLFFCHRPDPNTPVEETVRVMDDLIHQGKILYWGTSEWRASDIMRAFGLAKELGLTPPQMEQPQYNMFHRERFEVEYAPLYREIGLGATTFSPLASGLLTGKYRSGVPKDSRANLLGYEWLKERILSKENLEKVAKLEPIAKDLDSSLAQLALAWCLKNPNVSTVISGASRPDQVVENMKALDIVPKLDSEAMERIEAVLQNDPSLER